MLTIYHNPRCSKSRQTLALIEDSKTPHTTVLYLDTPPAAVILERALAILGRDVMLRTGEDAYKEHIKDKNLSEAALAALMVEHPSIIERPLVVADDGRMVMGRPPENVAPLLKGAKSA
ncbi:MAG: arsenate reductase (glutaredoxin) [Proteobacteria bacterium]|nr:arsenate reductase (glutaredoxin) [Pseudomonadota bacterium]